MKSNYDNHRYRTWGLITKYNKEMQNVKEKIYKRIQNKITNII